MRYAASSPFRFTFRLPSCRLVGRQHLAHIGLGYAKLARDQRWFDARLECCTNRIDLPTRQRNRQFPLPPVVRSRGTFRYRFLGLNACGRSAAPLRLFEGRGNEFAQTVMDFMATSEGLALAKAFMKIRSVPVRRRIVELIEGIVG